MSDILDLIVSFFLLRWLRGARSIGSPREGPVQSMDQAVKDSLRSHFDNSEEGKKLSALARAAEVARKGQPEVPR